LLQMCFLWRRRFARTACPGWESYLQRVSANWASPTWPFHGELSHSSCSPLVCCQDSPAANAEAPNPKRQRTLGSQQHTFILQVVCSARPDPRPPRAMRCNAAGPKGVTNSHLTGLTRMTLQSFSMVLFVATAKSKVLRRHNNVNPNVCLSCVPWPELEQGLSPSCAPWRRGGWGATCDQRCRQRI